MIRTLDNIEQGSDEWHDARRGIVTASVVGQLITEKTIKPASNDVSRAVTLKLVAERITGYTEPTYVSADMERGTFDEPIARAHYSEHIAPVTQVAFMTEDRFGFTLGFSPDGLVGSDGLIEIKSRRQKTQLKTILLDEVPAENMAQIQCGLLVSGRDWCDFVSWCGGMPMWTIRVFPDQQWHDAIIQAVTTFEETAADMSARYVTATAGLPETEREVDLYEEMRI